MALYKKEESRRTPRPVIMECDVERDVRLSFLDKFCNPHETKRRQDIQQYSVEHIISYHLIQVE